MTVTGLRTALTALLKRLLRQAVLPAGFDGSQLASKTDFLALDLELTGLDATTEHIVSMAWVPIRNMEIIVGEAEHHLITTSRGVGHSATIHGIHDHQSAGGRSLCEVLAQLLRQHNKPVLVAHHVRLDLEFLQQAAGKCGQPPLHWPAIDTLALEARRLRQQGASLTAGALTLQQCLLRHQLPAGQQHNALADAFGCAQLLLSQLSRHGDTRLTLRQLLRMA